MWIERAANKCRALGYTTLGDFLAVHAVEEVGHDKMMERDALGLAHFYLDKFGSLPVPKFSSPGLLNYYYLHEQVIESDYPYGQLAIEYEIEKLSIVWGPQLLAVIKASLGDECLEHLSFLKSHIAFDAVHTIQNKKVLSDFLEQYPDTLPLMIKSGNDALAAYSQFIKDCIDDKTGDVVIPPA